MYLHLSAPSAIVSTQLSVGPESVGIGGHCLGVQDYGKNLRHDYDGDVTLPLDTAANQNTLPPIGSNLTPNSAPNNSQASDQIPNQRHGSQQLGNPPPNPSVHVQSSRLQDDTLDMSTTQNRILFLANKVKIID
ncbi:hypothetical protein N7451_009341 [Penicillium sp. IBT 35674x]|nr:hypothetical protein N7451_009341 [Penicillium sp. IBT 35674x]